MSSNFYHYPVWVRIWHATNALLCLFLIVTGFSMLYSNPDNALVVKFQRAVAIHNVCGILLTFSYTMFLFGNLFTANGRHYLIRLKGLGQRLWAQGYYYAYGYFKGEKAPFPVDRERKFNPLQQVSYVGVMYFILPMLFVTGWALMFPEFILKKFLGVRIPDCNISVRTPVCKHDGQITRQQLQEHCHRLAGKPLIRPLIRALVDA